jgi:hypothetical protein
MRYLTVALVLMLSGCMTILEEDILVTAEQLCSVNGGLDKIIVPGNETVTMVCNNKAAFKFREEGHNGVYVQYP